MFWSGVSMCFLHLVHNFIREGNQWLLIEKKIVRYIIVIVFIIFAWGIFAHFQYNYITTNKKLMLKKNFLKQKQYSFSHKSNNNIYICLKRVYCLTDKYWNYRWKFNAFSNEVQKSMDNIKNFSIAPNNIQQFVFLWGEWSNHWP